MDVFKFDLSWDVLNGIEEEERTFALMLGKLHNEINMLSNLIVAFQTDESTTELEKQGRTARTFMFITILAGKLYEGYDFLRKQYYGAKISKKYYSLLNEDAQSALSEINKYFSGVSALNTVRNKNAFHFDAPLIKEHYASASQSDPCFIYLGAPTHCNFFQVSESVISKAIMNEIGGGDAQSGMNILMIDTAKIIGHFHIFVGAFMMEFLKINWEEVPEPNKVEMGTLPSMEKLNIPFLVEYTSKYDIS